MFKTISITAGLLALSMATNAAELNNNSSIGFCATTECALVNAGISFITRGQVGDTLYVMLMDENDRGKACSIVSPDELKLIDRLTGEHDDC